MSEKPYYDKYYLDQSGAEQTSADIFNSFRLISENTHKSLMETATTLYSAMERPATNSSYIDDEYQALNSIPQDKWDLSWTKYHLQVLKHLIPPQRIEQLRSMVKGATRQHRVFSISGNYISVRRSLVSRGWMEKVDHPNLVPVNAFNDDDIYNSLSIQRPDESRAAYMKRCENYILAILFQNVIPDFIWNYRLPQKDILTLPRLTVINRLLFNRFATKAGLANVLAGAHWFTIPKISHVNFPRCYLISDTDQQKEFIRDYKITASISLLKNFQQLYLDEGVSAVVSNTSGKLPLSVVYTAIQICYQYISERQHEDIDLPLIENDDVSNEDLFLESCYLFVHERQKFVNHKKHSINHIEKMIHNLFTEIPKYWSQMGIDGKMNIWIMKPAARCRGIGIRLVSHFKNILDMISEYENKGRYVCQKYIETPLLIYDHKFDIRQWFLVTSVQPLTVWIYKKCYLRFSSKPFNLSDFHEVVHLTNNSVQHKYKHLNKNDNIPSYNMWELDEFKTYLKTINKGPHFWDTHLFPQIKCAITCVLLASEDSMMPRVNSFQIFGADIMIDAQFKVWLIEVNSCPQMAPTTPVTQKLCPECFDDVIRVTVDKTRDSTSSTGNFELLYLGDIGRSASFHVPSHKPLNFELLGKQMNISKPSPYTTNYYRLPNITTVSQLLLPIDGVTVPKNDFNEETNSKSELSTSEEDFEVLSIPLEQKLRFQEIESHYEKNERNTRRVYTLHGSRAILALKNIPEKKEGTTPIQSELQCIDRIPANWSTYLDNSAELFKNKIQKNLQLKNVKILYSNKTYPPKIVKKEPEPIPQILKSHISGGTKKNMKRMKPSLKSINSTTVALDNARIIEECKKNIQKIEQNFKRDFENSILSKINDSHKDEIVAR